jgi:hypothetical protein
VFYGVCEGAYAFLLSCYKGFLFPSRCGGKRG